MKELKRSIEAYLDIETTGLSPRYTEITVVGIHLISGDDSRFVQIIGDDITLDNVLEALEGVSVIYTYNGSRFDLPFIYYRLGVNLAKEFKHCDLMYYCWQNNLYGGLKSVERQLSIQRRVKDITGYEAVRLWWSYINDHNEEALVILLEYNKEDVINLKTLKEKLI